MASLLGLQLEAVPDIWAGPHIPADAPIEHHQPLDLELARWAWLKREHQMMVCAVRFDNYRTVSGAWREAWLWVDAQEVVVGEDQPYEAAGRNPDGARHIVICAEGKILHDPNPARRGIVDCDYIDWILPLANIPPKHRDLPMLGWRVP